MLPLLSSLSLLLSVIFIAIWHTASMQPFIYSWICSLVGGSIRCQPEGLTQGWRIYYPAGALPWPAGWWWIWMGAHWGISVLSFLWHDGWVLRRQEMETAKFLRPGNRPSIVSALFYQSNSYDCIQIWVERPGTPPLIKEDQSLTFIYHVIESKDNLGKSPIRKQHWRYIPLKKCLKHKNVCFYIIHLKGTLLWQSINRAQV